MRRDLANASRGPSSVNGRSTRIGTEWHKTQTPAKSVVGILRRISEVSTRRYHDQNVFGNRLKITSKVHGALQGQNFLLLRLNAKMPKRRLIKRLHALRCHRDLHTTDLKQSHRTKIDITIAGDRAGRPDFSVAQFLHLERARERNNSFGTIGPPEFYRDLCAFAHSVCSLHGLLITQVA